METTKEDKIIDIICNIPLENWNGLETELNGKKIIIAITWSEFNPYYKLIIDGVYFNSIKIEKYGKLVHALRESNILKSKSGKIDEIFNALSK